MQKESDSEDPFGPEAHDRGTANHSGKRGHYCLEWDGLWICEDCPEFECCLCFPREPHASEEK